MIYSDSGKDPGERVVTRFAPSPTGSLHIGGARTALFNYLWAKRLGGTFLLRFEDTDKTRSSREYESSIYEDLMWLGITPDEEPIRQTSRSARHAEILSVMIKNGFVYPCFCTEDGSHALSGTHKCRDMTPEERNLRLSSGEARCWRFKTERGKVFTYRDRLRGEISVPTDAIEDFTLARSDGSVTYLLAVVVDDHDCRATHVIRGEEHLSNVPKQEMIYRAMEWDVPEWVHIPMILDGDRHKLSKRSGAVSIGRYREDGWNPDAVVSYLSTLSWSGAPTDRTLPPDELAKIFDIGSVARFSPVHDELRMTHFGKISMSKATDGDLLEWCGDSFGSHTQTQLPDAEKIRLVRELLSSHATRKSLEDGVRRELSLKCENIAFDVPVWFSDLKDVLETISEGEWRSSEIMNVMKSFAKERGLGGKDFFHPVRILLTGSPKGAPMNIILSCIGKDKTLKRFEICIRRGIS
jgi:glutamyl-tRNA synthetase